MTGPLLFASNTMGIIYTLYLFIDVENYDLICLGESLHEIKVTLQKLVDNVTELEYKLYLIRRDAK